MDGACVISLPLSFHASSFHREPAHALDEASFDLTTCRSRDWSDLPDVVQDVDAEQAILAGQRVDDDSDTAGAVAEIVERHAAPTVLRS